MMVGQLSRKVGTLEGMLVDAERVRRKLHNDLVEIRGNIRVFVRIRPTDKRSCTRVLSQDSVRLHVDNKPNDFFFDRYACAPLLQI
jgi:hypothetical protein